MNGSEQIVAIVVGMMFLAGVVLGVCWARQRSSLRMRGMK